MILQKLGWSTHFETLFGPYRERGQLPARVVGAARNHFELQCQDARYLGEVSGRLLHLAAAKSDLPVVGDWVSIETRPGEQRATIHSILPRTTAIARQSAGTVTERQILAANIDTVFVVVGLDLDFNLRRIERYLTVAHQSGVAPVVVLNKADVCAEVETRIAQIESVALHAPVHALSARTGLGLAALDRFLRVGQTIALLGSSGVGKSTIVNRVLGFERQQVRVVREGDHRGRHTTTRGELISLPSGANLVDTPGLREIQLWADESAVSGTFEEIEALARTCRFRDCRHESEPGCAVRESLARGELDEGRLEGYRKLAREVRYHARREDQSLRIAEQRKWKQIHKAMRQRSKHDPKRQRP